MKAASDLIIKKRKEAKGELQLISVSEITGTNKTIVARPDEHSTNIPKISVAVGVRSYH